MEKNITIKNISERTGVSITTVSRVLNGVSKKYRISDTTAALVKVEAERLNFKFNIAAVNFRLKRSTSIGLMVPNLSNPFFSNIAGIINKELIDKNYSVILTVCDEEEASEVKGVEALISRNVDGLIVMPSGKTVKHLESINKNKMTPVICIDRYFEDMQLPYVATDNYDGAYRITNYLIECGHIKIACIQGLQHVMPNVQRIKGYLAAMKNAGLDAFCICGDDFTIENGYRETKILLQRKEKPTAVFSLSDTIALGALKAIKEEGWSVPGNISLVTFDNSVYLDFLSTPITSVRQPVEDIARIAIKLLLDKIEIKRRDNDEAFFREERILIPPSIIYRDSVKKI